MTTELEVKEQVLSKKALKKQEKQALKEAKKAEAKSNQQQQQQSVHWSSVIAHSTEASPYGVIPFNCKIESRVFSRIKELNSNQKGEKIWLRGRITESRCKGSLGFVLLRQTFYRLQLVVDANNGSSKEMIKWLGCLPIESMIDVYGTIVVPETPVVSSTQDIEVLVERVYCVSSACSELPFQLKDANRVETEDEDSTIIKVLQDVRLDNRVLDLRTYLSQAIFRIQSEVCRLLREFLIEREFIEIHTPKLLPGASESGATVFKVDYFSNTACLAQSPQLHKQMSICGDLERVFEIGPVFRAENSNTHRHLCEFVGVDIEMNIENSYHELVDVFDAMFRHIFQGINTRCKNELLIVSEYNPFTPFIISEKTPRLTFEEGCNLLKESGADIPEDLSDFDISTEQERLLGKFHTKDFLVRLREQDLRMAFIVLNAVGLEFQIRSFFSFLLPISSYYDEKYNSDFYMMLKYPLKVRPFYTMPDFDEPEKWSNSFDFFMRGEEILSGAQRVHDYDLLVKRCKECGVSEHSLRDYLNSFKLGAPPHGGCGIGLERVIMLFLNLGNIRKSSMFPRDPKRLSP
ncbi:tRNA synthetases class II (D K and N) family protein [Cryptosporidium meleagridis]|uniref:aspartate--tRNA ligase n=1 Tax=Cryptosporidium meleagridis TaxID=93969 RepID=A0A2P4Z1X4_9CRYT|nr:tRNA synthetases class II (D K and N) family protein [Cryptosporidium meleagridis]